MTEEMQFMIRIRGQQRDTFGRNGWCLGRGEIPLIHQGRGGRRSNYDFLTHTHLPSWVLPP